MRVREAEAGLQIQEALAKEGAEKFAKANPGAEIPERVRRVSSIARAEARLGRAQAALELARLQLARTNISLPYDSRVVRSDVEVGELVGPAENVGRSWVLGVVYRPGALQVRAPVEPKDLKNFAPMVGRSARLSTWAGKYDGKVVRVSPVVAPRTRLGSMFLNFANDTPAERLPAPGTFAEIAVTGPTRDKVFVLPEAAARDRDSVWVVRKGALTSFTPKIARPHGGRLDRRAVRCRRRRRRGGSGQRQGRIAGDGQGIPVAGITRPEDGRCARRTRHREGLS